MSLLDDVSIVVTPNGYKAGELYAVVPAASLGNNVIVNGDFATDSDWNKGTGWTISGGSANCDGSQTGATNLTPNVDNVTNNTVYKTTYTISNYVSGSIRIKLGNTGQGQYHSANGTYTEEIKALVTTFPRSQFNADVDFKGSIDNVLVEEVISADMDVTRATAATRVDEAGLVNYAEIIGGEEITNGNFATDSDWTKGTGTTISGGLANLDGSAGAFVSALYQDIPLISGKTYRITFNISNFVSGSLRIRFDQSFTAIGNMTQDGFYEFTKVAASNDDRINFVTNAINTICSIDNVSVKEQSRDNVPRIDYSGGGCPHILAEPQRTNLVTYSSDFTDSSWNLDGLNVNLTRTSNATTSPSGEENATKLIGNNISKDPNNSYIGVNTSAAAPYTTSIFAKKGEYDYLVSGIGSYAGGYYAIFNLSNGTVSTSPTASGTTASIEDFGNGWYRCLVNTTNTGGSEILFLSTSVDGTLTTNYTNTTNGIFVYGGQVENGSYATSYIPTSGSTVTRNQDQFTRDGIGSLINSTEGVLFAEISAFSNDGTNRTIALSDGTGNNLVRFYFSNSSNRIVAQVKVGGSTQVTFDITGITVTDFNKVALKYKENDFSIWINGIERGIDTNGSVPTGLNRLALDNGASGELLFGKVKQLQVYKTALTDAQLTSLTS